MRDLAWQITEETGVRQLVGTDKNQFPVYERFKMKGKTLQLLKEHIGKYHSDLKEGSTFLNKKQKH